MQLNANGKLAKFYMWLPPDDKRLPQDFCTYFWGLVSRAVFIGGIGGMAALGLLLGIVKFATWLFYLITTHKKETLVTLIMLAIVAVVIWLANLKQKVKVEIFSEAKAIIKVKVDAVKNRYCPRIEWK